ncbi:MAG: dihydrolipoyllysine-residue acetyltransferase [Cellvibrionaceae bacterium]
MSKQTVKVPDIGTDQAAEVAEVLVAQGDLLEVEQSIIVLETDKASVEVPSSHAGKVLSVLVKEGDELKTGAPILEIETEADAAPDADVEAEPSADKESSADKKPSAEEREPSEKKQKPSAKAEKPSGKQEPSAGKKEPSATAKQEPSATAKQKPSATTKQKPSATKQQPSAEKAPAREIQIPVPDIGDSGDVEVIEVSVAVGDEIEEGDSLIVLESDKASMELPSPSAGKVIKLLVAEGDKVKQGQQVAVLQPAGAAPAAEKSDTAQQPTEEKSRQAPAREKPEAAGKVPQAESARVPQETADGSVYAGPAVRKLARQLGVDLSKIKSSGPRHRVTKDDVRSYVKEIVAGGGKGGGIPEVPAIDFGRFGETKRVKMSKIKRSTAANMHRSWLNVPHVTQFDDADITELETYRKKKKSEAEKRGTKLTPLPFLVKACALTLKAEPSFNVSLDPDGQHIVEKQYLHIGVAVDTPGGLMVPVIRDVDQKDIWQLAEESIELAGKAREGKLSPKDMQGGCFTISSLGTIGGQGFTPVVNTPEVGILGVSKAAVKPHWDGKNFVPRTMLPLSLSYDHRAVNGADAGRFLTHLVGLLGDYRDWVG